MSSFSTLNTALTALNAQRQAIDITGQNLANVKTAGYTHQRVSLTALPATSPATLSSGSVISSGGVRATSVDRLGDAFLEMRLRQTTSSASSLAQVADAWTDVEAVLQEPGKEGLSAQLDAFYASWQDVANNPDNDAVRATLLQGAQSLVSKLQESYSSLETQWDTARAQADTTAIAINTAAARVADLNQQITAITASGGSANELIDQRATLLVTLAGLAGAETATRSDGSVDVMVGGNALVRGTTVHEVRVVGTRDFASASDAPSATNPLGSGPVRLVWSEDTDHVITMSGGTLDGMLQVMSAQGPLATTAADYNAIAAQLASHADDSLAGVTLDTATSINQMHRLAYQTDGTTAGGAFFQLDASLTGKPAVMQLSVAVGSASQIAVAEPGMGGADAHVADRISRLTDTTDAWAAAVATIGVQSSRAQALAGTSETSRASAEQQLLAGTSVDEAEETMNLIAYQRAFQSAARLTSTIDEMLDTLINRMAQ